ISFFFQAEDGIRDRNVTGVQTCALPVLMDPLFYSLWRPVQMSDENKLAALIILDGFACRDEVKGNAVQQAKKPNFDRYWNAFPHNQLQASGRSVGLPEGQMGNSAVGHLNIGARRIVYQSLSRVNLSSENGEFFEREAFLKAIRRAKTRGTALHIFGLLSDGGGHSHIDHLFAILKLAREEQL